jgi:GNAT superfamily N-acetyltransferase
LYSAPYFRYIKLMICTCNPSDTQKIYFIINEAAKAYEGVIPADRYHQPYMTMDELQREMKRMTFFGWEADGELVGVMGFEPIKDVTLIRHAYVLPRWQRQGIASRLLAHLKGLVTTPRLLVGTWADAYWAIEFYVKHGFTLMPDKDELLETYWDIPPRQIETSIVMGMEVDQKQEVSPG